MVFWKTMIDIQMLEDGVNSILKNYHRSSNVERSLHLYIERIYHRYFRWMAYGLNRVHWNNHCSSHVGRQSRYNFDLKKIKWSKIPDFCLSIINAIQNYWSSDWHISELWCNHTPGPCVSLHPRVNLCTYAETLAYFRHRPTISGRLPASNPINVWITCQV